MTSPAQLEQSYALLDRLRALALTKQAKKASASGLDPTAIVIGQAEAKLSDADAAALPVCIEAGWIEQRGAKKPSLRLTNEGRAFLEQSTELGQLLDARRDLAATRRDLGEKGRALETLVAKLGKPRDAWRAAQKACEQATRQLITALEGLDREFGCALAELVNEAQAEHAWRSRAADVERRLALAKERLRTETETECARALDRLAKVAARTDGTLAKIEADIAAIRAEVAGHVAHIGTLRTSAREPSPPSPAEPARADKLDRLGAEVRHLVASRGFATIPDLRASMHDRHGWSARAVDDLLPDLPRHDRRFFFGAPSPKDAYLDGLRIHGQAYFYVRCSDE